ncbi:MAG: hypothetical protein WC824_07700 [Bacteroidota bacterium]
MNAKLNEQRIAAMQVLWENRFKEIAKALSPQQIKNTLTPAEIEKSIGTGVMGAMFGGSSSILQDALSRMASSRFDSRFTKLLRGQYEWDPKGGNGQSSAVVTSGLSKTPEISPQARKAIASAKESLVARGITPPLKESDISFETPEPTPSDYVEAIDEILPPSEVPLVLTSQRGKSDSKFPCHKETVQKAPVSDSKPIQDQVRELTESPVEKVSKTPRVSKERLDRALVILECFTARFSQSEPASAKLLSEVKDLLEDMALS